MTTIVAHVSTGRSGQTATIRGTGRLSGQVVNTAASTTDVTWTVTRWQVLKFAVADAAEVTPQQAGYVATVLMAIWANESGWGANEWNFNGCGMHCSSGDAQCTEWPRDGEDPRLAAYGDLAEAIEEGEPARRLLHVGPVAAHRGEHRAQRLETRGLNR